MLLDMILMNNDTMPIEESIGTFNLYAPISQNIMFGDESINIKNNKSLLYCDVNSFKIGLILCLRVPNNPIINNNT